MKIETIKVTPEMAAEWLSANTDNNRKISRHLVNKYARDMMKGEWQQTGEAIKFDDQGHLIDGQHRLSAVVASKKNVPMLVVTGLKNEVIQVVDTGRSRSAGDALTIAGLAGENGGATAALARKIMAWRSGTDNLFDTKKIKLRGEAIANRDIVAFCKQHDLGPFVRFAWAINRRQISRIFNVGEWAFLFWMFSQKDPKAAEYFLSRLATLDGVPADEGNPIRALFNKLSRSAGLDGKGRLYATITAWNAMRRGESLTLIRVVYHAEATMPLAV